LILFWMNVWMIFVLALSACGQDIQPTYIPSTLIDDDPLSVFAREIRSFNSGKAEALEAREAITGLHDQIDLSARQVTQLERLEASLDAGALYLDPRRVAWLVADGLAESRDTFYVLYGWLHDWEIERERPLVKELEIAVGLLGYRLEVNETTHPNDWFEAMHERNAAGLLWRSEGWVSHYPEGNPEEVISRVWTTEEDPEGKWRIFANDWARVLPEGLVFVDIASCGTAGPFMNDEMNTLENLGDPEKLVVRSFHTELHDRTVFTRTYAGLLATSGYFLSPMDELALARLPDRSGIDPERVQTAYERFLAELAPSTETDYSACLSVFGSNPQEWIPALIESLEQGRPVNETLGRLADRLTGSRPEGTSAQAWRDWWSQTGTILDQAPPEVRVWLTLSADFTRETGLYKGDPAKGAAVESGTWCRESWFRRLFAELGPWTIENDRLVQRTPTTDRHGHSLASQPLEVVFDPESGTLTHNLADVLAGVTDEMVQEGCASGTAD
jgi:hypothetical protein